MLTDLPIYKHPSQSHLSDFTIDLALKGISA